jgi:hypothetical protein
MPLLPPTLPSLGPHSHASCLPWLVVVLPLVLHHLSFLSRYRLPSGGASTCPLLVPLPPLIVPLIFSGVVASRLPRLFVVSPLFTLLLPVCLRLCLSLHRHLSLHFSHVSCPAACHVASHHANASSLPAPLTLVVHHLWLHPPCASLPLWLVVV